MSLRVGIVGTGNIFARGYLPALLETDAIEVAAVCDIDAARARDAAKSLGSPRIEAAHRELVAADDLEAVLVLTPTHTHAEISIAALDAGKHVLCEKPMARSATDARRMIVAADGAGRRLMIGHTRRFDERWTAIHDQVRAGRIGEPVYLFRSEHAYNGAPGDAWTWQDAQSGGVLWDVGVHVAELVHWFFGERPRSAFTRLLHVRPESVAGGAPDAAVVSLEMGDTRHAVLSVSWLHPPAWGPFYASMEVIGTGGRLDYRDLDGHPTIVADAEGLTIARHSPLLSATAPAFLREIEHFALALESGGPFAISAEEALAAVEIVEAAERSAASGRPEAVPS
ncbi:MAG TPA: Gfo/Idh/MocA family oxidoreductase [Candidatus Limnocylindria bacterium]